jgi:epoxyqueuosine reductase QueG
MHEHIESILLAALFFPSAAAVLIFAMKYGSAVAQARVRLGQDEAYRELAAKAATSQAGITAALSSFGTVLAEIQSRLAVVEKILKDVE